LDDGWLSPNARWSVRTSFDRKIADFVISERGSLRIVPLKRVNLLEGYTGDWLLGFNTIDEIKRTLLLKGGMSFRRSRVCWNRIFGIRRFRGIPRRHLLRTAGSGATC